MLFRYLLRHDGITFGVEGDRPYGFPVTCMACPTWRMALLGLDVLQPDRLN